MDHSGAVVKTIGDAFHATFPNPPDAVQAALAMVAALDAFNPITANHLHHKIGLHQGQALAVKLNNRIDYFGQSVNLAAQI